MHKHRSKREQRIRFILTYTIVPVIIVSFATVLVLYMLGWRYNVSERTVEQGGLMQFDSRPSGATITINGQQLDRSIISAVGSRQDMSAGTHTVRMEYEGYQPWQKTVQVESGKILWLNYTRFIPNDIAVDTVAEYESLHDALAAPYGEEKMLLQPQKDQPIFELVETDNSSSDEVPRQELTIPADILSDVSGVDIDSQEFRMMNWDDDARYVTVQHRFGDKVEWLVVDTDRVDRSQNITTIAERDITNVQFDVRNARAVYVRAGNGLHRVDLSQRVVSERLINNVAEFRQSDEGVITYISTPKSNETAQRTIGYYTPGAARAKAIKTVDNTSLDELQAHIIEYSTKQYYVERQADELSVSEIGLHPSDSTNAARLSNPLSFNLPSAAGTMSVSSDARFVLIQKGASFVTYDLELEKLTTTAQVGDGGTRRVQWLDRHILWSDRGGMLHTYEFDGENGHDIVKVAPGFDVSLSPEGRYLYVVQQRDGAWQLSRARLILEN